MNPEFRLCFDSLHYLAHMTPLKILPGLLALLAFSASPAMARNGVGEAGNNKVSALLFDAVPGAAGEMLATAPGEASEFESSLLLSQQNGAGEAGDALSIHLGKIGSDLSEGPGEAGKPGQQAFVFSASGPEPDGEAGPITLSVGNGETGIDLSIEHGEAGHTRGKLLAYAPLDLGSDGEAGPPNGLI
jgi:hypothetical protein